MAQSDINTFVADLLLRYDPTLDTSEGSAFQVEVIAPLMARIGTDPFDEDLHTFVRERVRQVFPDIAITEVDEFTDLVIDPIRVLFEPLVREIKLVKLRSSLANTESLGDEEVDALMANFFEARRNGSYALGVVRAYFSSPQSVTVTVQNPAFAGSLRFRTTRPQQITADQMMLNVDGSEYYFDINYTAESRGEEYNVEAGAITSISGLPGATRVRNLRRFREGTVREGSVEFVGRAQRNASGDRTMVVERGIQSVLTEAFPALRRLFTVGYRDPEMQRDIIRGGSLGPILPVDTYGNPFGQGTVTADGFAGITSGLIEALTGNFVTRIGAVGTAPSGWFVTLGYSDTTVSPSVVMMADFEILEVISSTRLRIDAALPLGAMAWGLRQRTLTISDIPGGITLPDTTDGTLEVQPDEVHIGGKTDIYVAGESEVVTAVITGLSDEEPFTNGVNAQTAGTDVVILNDLSAALFPDVVAGMSLVLDEGSDAGSYRILSVVSASPPYSFRIQNILTGTQPNLAWRVIDKIDVELTDPKQIKLVGADITTAAGSTVVSTASGSNFIDADVRRLDILEIDADVGGGEFTISEVNALSLIVDPPAPRTLIAAPYRIFRRSEPVLTPVLRISSIEIVDSTGAPTGSMIPFRDPVAILSEGTQNQSSGTPFEGDVSTGLVTALFPGAVAISGDIDWALYDPEQVWAGAVASGTVSIPAASYTATSLAALINLDAGFIANGVTAVVQDFAGLDYVGFVANQLLAVTALTGTTSSTGLVVGGTNSQLKVISSISNLAQDYPTISGDVFEMLSGNNIGVRARVGQTRVPGQAYTTDVGTGPLQMRAGATSTLPGITVGHGLSHRVLLRPEFFAAARIGRPSVGSARAYFLAPTSVTFTSDSSFTTTQNEIEAEYRGDPDITRVLIPAPPRVDSPQTGLVGPDLTDTDADFLASGVAVGDSVVVKYSPLTGVALVGTLLLSGTSFKIKVGSAVEVTLTFPSNMTLDQAVEYVNTQVGRVVVSNNSGTFRVLGVDTITISAGSPDALAVLLIAAGTTAHLGAGTYIISDVTETVLSFSAGTPMAVVGIADTTYEVKRPMQRISSTEMNDNLDASGLYFFDVEVQSTAPGDYNNTAAGVQFTAAGYESDGYRVTTDLTTTSYSRAEILRAEFSPSILLVGSPDDPNEALGLSQQSIQITYDRSQLVDEIQSFADSKYQRALCSEPLVRHLLPHYVSMRWTYSGGASEADAKRLMTSKLDAVEADVPLEVTELTAALRGKGATTVFTPDPEAASGRTSPLLLVVAHNLDRTLSAQIVRDRVETGRTARYMPDSLVLRRTTTGGIR